MKLKIGGKVALVEEITSGAIQRVMNEAFFCTSDFWLYLLSESILYWIYKLYLQLSHAKLQYARRAFYS
jgi:hypothetical protein